VSWEVGEMGGRRECENEACPGHGLEEIKWLGWEEENAGR